MKVLFSSSFHPSASRLETRQSLIERQRDCQEPNTYRRNVGICLVNANGLVFAARRQNARKNTWEMPQGGIDGYEGALAAARRELREETGVTSARVVYIMDNWLEYDIPRPARESMAGYMRPFRGQTQKWVLMYFYGDDAEIDLEGCAEQELVAYRWMPMGELLDTVIEFKGAVYSAVVKEFAPLIQERLQAKTLDTQWWTRKG